MTEYCTFALAPPTAERAKFRDCTIITTDSAIYLYDEEAEPAALSIELPFESIRGVGLVAFGLGRQIQIPVETGVLAMIIWNSSRSVHDTEASADLYERLRAAGVPDVEGGEIIIDIIDGPIFIPIFL